MIHQNVAFHIITLHYTYECSYTALLLLVCTLCLLFCCVCVCLLQMGIHRGADLGGDRGGRSPPILNVGGKESLISPPIFHEYNKKMPQSPPIVALGGIGGDGGLTKKLKNFHLHPPPVTSSSRRRRIVPPKFWDLGGRFNFFPDLSPPNPWPSRRPWVYIFACENQIRQKTQDG